MNIARLRSWTLLLGLVTAAGCGDDSSDAHAGDGGDDGAGLGADAGAVVVQVDNDNPTIVTVQDGRVEGDVVEGSIRFLAIPYAAPPVGELRWKAPVRPAPWASVRHETEFSSPCPQAMSQQTPESTNEDCLYLNVWRPEEATEDAPVMVWFHGGGNTTGSTADVVPQSGDHLWYDGKVFAARHGIVVVTVNYRLGAFGFMALPELADEGSPLGNQGLQDQQHALRWVRDNIAAFGGDPENVTIFGESAGSADVCLHLASPGSRGLFHRAISQSGGCTMSRSADEDPVPALRQWAADAGCEGEGAQLLACLRGKQVAELISLEPTERTSGGSTGARVFGVVVDGEGGFLPDPAADLFARGDVAQVPYLIGSNTEEGMLYFVFADVPSDDTEYRAFLAERFSEDFADRILALYPVSRFDGNYRHAVSRVVGDSGLVCGTHDTARAAASAGLDVYLYNFNIPWSIAPTVFLATHASEISHVFGTPYDETPEHEAVAEAMNAYWARFARTGDPNGEGAPAQWPRFDPDDDQRLQLDPEWEVLSDFRVEECALWREYAASL